ncbi:hypothetical protein O3P69_010393 [Scylla paramamosain]|uniref:ribonuclease H n=1 Tax=Scylla paramamosain TaxID=85552 RepID=A0AAW0TVP1_SCYPA
MPNTIFRLSGYQVFLTPQTGGTNGLATLVKNTLPAIKIADTPDCGEGNEVLGVRVTTRNNELAIYNVYRKANTDFIASELLSTVYYDTVLIGGDFNAHHPQFNPNLGKINAAGRQIVSLLEHIPEWNIKHINWPTFQQDLDTWSETYITPDDINEAEKNLVQAFHAALDKACPVSSHSNRHYKDHWFYDDEVKELYARVNSARKRFRRQRTEDNKELLQAAVRSSDRRLKEIRREKWLEWCSQLNAHTSLARLWDHIRRVTGKTRTRAPLHPTPQVEAERLATLFRDRASSAQLPTNTRRRQDDRLLARRNTIATACQQPSPSDLISQGNAKHRKAQVALLKIEQMCTELGLKINPLKTKAMLIKERRIPEGNLRIQDTDIEWVQKHQCLGIHFDYRLSFKPQVEYLKERMDTRINAMKGMTALSSGADYDVLRSYYVHAVRSLIDYSSIALVGLNPTELHALQVQQNKAMRLIVGAPIWTKLSNLQVETGIAPVEARITKNVAVATAKLLTTPGYPLTRSRLRTAAAQGEQFDTTRWTRKANIALSSSGLRYVGALDEDTACEGYTEPPPWTENHTVYSCKLPEAPRDDTVRRRIHGELQIARLTINDAAVFYTDGSVDEDGRSGAAFIYNGEQFLTRLSDGCSSMQAEMVAIQQATAHATTLPNTDIIIHTDSQSAMEALQARNLKDNIRLTTSVKRNIRELQRQRKTVTINWIPSHVGIHGNESADMAAKTAALLAEVTTHVQPSLSAMKMAARRRETTITTNRNRTYAAEGSRSCQWYRGVTDGKRLRIPRGTPRTLRVHLHRLRLGYVCNWRIRQQEVRPCAHCGVHQEEPLLHWVLQCDKTEQLRHQLSTHHMNPQEIEARGTAVRMLKTLFSSHMDILTNTIQQYPPPR